MPLRSKYMVIEWTQLRKWLYLLHLDCHYISKDHLFVRMWTPLNQGFHPCRSQCGPLVAPLCMKPEVMFHLERPLLDPPMSIKYLQEIQYDNVRLCVFCSYVTYRLVWPTIYLDSFCPTPTIQLCHQKSVCPTQWYQCCVLKNRTQWNDWCRTNWFLGQNIGIIFRTILNFRT